MRALGTDGCDATASLAACPHTCLDGYFGGAVHCAANGSFSVESCVPHATCGGNYACEESRAFLGTCVDSGCPTEGVSSLQACQDRCERDPTCEYLYYASAAWECSLLVEQGASVSAAAGTWSCRREAPAGDGRGAVAVRAVTDSECAAQ